jgi:hypothetical protein
MERFHVYLSSRPPKPPRNIAQEQLHYNRRDFHLQAAATFGPPNAGKAKSYTWKQETAAQHLQTLAAATTQFQLHSRIIKERKGVKKCVTSMHVLPGKDGEGGSGAKQQRRYAMDL